MNRLYVGNLPYSCDDRRLAELFSAAGTVTYARISTDRETGRHRGFGFVTMASVQETENARHLFNGHTEDGRELVVDLAREQRVARA